MICFRRESSGFSAFRIIIMMSESQVLKTGKPSVLEKCRDTSTGLSRMYLPLFCSIRSVPSKLEPQRDTFPACLEFRVHLPLMRGHALLFACPPLTSSSNCDTFHTRFLFSKRFSDHCHRRPSPSENDYRQIANQATDRRTVTTRNERGV